LSPSWPACTGGQARIPVRACFWHGHLGMGMEMGERASGGRKERNGDMEEVGLLSIEERRPAIRTLAQPAPARHGGGQAASAAADSQNGTGDGTDADGTRVGDSGVAVELREVAMGREVNGRPAGEKRREE